ncbi:MAG: beta-lactamase family protein [Myxococcota bacterium]|nr:beta-lactamase family protein [Myxococcota bacterium]
MRTLLVLMLLSSTASAQPAKIDAIMKPWTGTATPGCAVGVVQKGKVTHAKGYGMADLERKVPITPSTLFDIGSTSKQFTAANILMLAAEGKLKLDDDIRTYLPELPVLTKKPVTIRHLMHHSGGLRDYMPLLGVRGKRIEDVTTSKETVEALARQKGVDFEPGAKFEYSNTGYFLLAQIAERADKRPFREQVTARIFKPVGMTTSQIFDDHHRIIPGRALGYGPAEPSGWRFDTSQWEQTGDGSVITSVVDLAKWDAHFYAPKIGGGKALLDAQLEKGKLADGKELDYAAGLFHQKFRDQAVVAHGGAWAGFRAELIRFPALKTSVMVLCNAASSDPGKIARDIAVVVLDKQLGPKPAPPPPPAAAITLTPTELDAWAGRYRETTSGEVIVVRRDGAKLVVEAGGTHPLEPTSKSVFRLGPSPFRLEFAGTAPKRTAGLRGPREENFVEVGGSYKPTAAEIAALAGRYWSSELAVLWTIRIEKGAAVIDVFDQTGLPLEMTGKDEIASTKGGIGLTIQRGPRGIRGLAASAFGVRGIVFERL